MTEVCIVLSLFAALAWAIVRAVLMVVRPHESDEVPAHQADPISTYVDENYGSHFVDDPISINHSMRKR